MASPKVYILILNWNGWRDTIECLESVFRIDYPRYRVIVCDNASEDESLEHIKAWAEGRLDVAVPKDSPLRHLSFPAVPKPIRCAEYDRRHAELGGDRSDDPPLVLIQTSGNLGFAGGCNVGLRYALARADFDYVWLLNNDTVVEPDALTKMLKRMAEKPDAGMCGSTLLYYNEPDKVQALGGAVYNKWFGVPRHIGELMPVSRPRHAYSVEREMSYVCGASMLVSRPFLEEIGLMSEEYFLYFEELDWALRTAGCYKLAYAVESRVYHKEGRTIGSNADPRERSRTADYYGIRNRLLLTRRFFPFALPTVYLGLVLTMGRRVWRGQWDRLAMILKCLISKC